jgi:GxxExxY protein
MEIITKLIKETNLQPIPQKTEGIAKKILNAAFKVHIALGPGLLGSVYETCLAHELNQLGKKFGAQTTLPIVYDGIPIESGLRLDLYVEKCAIVEIKAAEIILPIHKAQLLTYLKLSGTRIGF